MFSRRNLFLSLIVVFVLGLAAAGKFLPAKDEKKTETKKEDQKIATSSAEPVSTPPTEGLTKGEAVSPNYRLETQINPTPQAPVTKPVQKTVTLEINGNVYHSYKVNWIAGMTVWDVLDKASKENNFKVKATWYPNKPLESYYITGIAETVCECWEYSVNGVKQSVGVSKVAVSENDIIIWKKI